MTMERSRSYSGGWNKSSRPKPPCIATVKPISKSFSEDDLLKIIDDKQTSPRVFSRLKIDDLSALKKDNLIGELEKCLEELEEKHGATQHLSDNYQKVEDERNQLLDELDIAFQDLQEYMQRQKTIEDQKENIEHDKEELIQENEYLKAVLSNRSEIQQTKAEEKNKHLQTRVKDLEHKNTELVDEINDLYAERQTLISSLLNLHSEDVDDVIKKRSRSSSVTSRESLDDREHQLDVDYLEKKLDDLEHDSNDIQTLQKNLRNIQQEHTELLESFEKLKTEKEEQENKTEKMKEEHENIEKSCTEKLKDYAKLQEERNEKNLGISKLSLEKRTLQRQLDHMRESNRSHAGKVTVLTDEVEKLKAKIEEMEKLIEENDQLIEIKIKEATSEYEEELDHNKNEYEAKQKEYEAKQKEYEAKQNEYEALLESKKILENDLSNTKKSSATQVKEEKLEHEKLLSEIGLLKTTITDLEANLLTRETNCLALQKRNNELTSDRDRLQKTIEQNKVNFEKLRQEKETFERESAHIKEECINKENETSQRINTLETEKIKLVSSESTWKETCERLKKSLKSNQDDKTNSDIITRDQDEKITNTQRKYDGVKKENDRLLQKCRHLEKSIGENEKYTSEIKRLKDANEILLQRYRALQSEKGTNVGQITNRTSEREKYSALLVKYDNLCTQYDNLCNQHKTINESLDNTSMATETMNEQIKGLETTLTEVQKNYNAIFEENSTLKENLKNNAQMDNMQNENKTLQNRIQSLLNEMKELKDSQENVEKDYQYIIKSHIEEAKVDLANKLNKLMQERDAIKTKYDILRVECDKSEKEKTHYKKTLESMREENTKLHNQIQKHRLMSDSSQDIKKQRLREENESLERSIDALQNTLNNTNAENKSLLERLNRNDESITTTIRSLKARKNELQLQVETLKHDNQQLRLNLRIKTDADVTRAASNPNISLLHVNTMDVLLTDNLRNAHSKMAELELENREYSRKLQESEGLLYDLQQALAQANDLAMQKSLEGSKTKRSLESKVEKLYHDNTELRRKLYFSSPKSDEVSPASLFPQSPILAKKTDEVTMKSRKASLPVKIPKSIESDHSFTNSGNIFTYQDGRLSFDADNSRSSSSSVPASPRITASRQVENDLSQQLRELLDLTNDLTSVKEEDPKSQESDESIAPPIPPPPVSYEIKECNGELSDNEPTEDIDDILDSLSKVADDLEQKGKDYEHWV